MGVFRKARWGSSKGRVAESGAEANTSRNSLGVIRLFARGGRSTRVLEGRGRAVQYLFDWDPSVAIEAPDMNANGMQMPTMP